MKNLSDVSLVLREVQALATTITRPSPRAEAFLDLAVAQRMLGMNCSASLRAAVQAAETASSPAEKCEIWCSLALAAQDLREPFAAYLTAAEQAAQAATGIMSDAEILLTRARLGLDTEVNLAAASERVRRMLPKEQPRAWAALARYHLEQRDWKKAQQTIHLLNDAYERIHMSCELAVALGQGEAGAAILKTTLHEIEQLPERAHRIEATCFIIVANGLLGQETKALLQACQEAAAKLVNPRSFARAMCQIAAAQAQLGLLSEARLTAKRITLKPYQDSAFQTLATAEATAGQFDDARATIARITGIVFHDYAMWRYVQQLMKAAVRATKLTVTPCLVNRRDFVVGSG